MSSHSQWSSASSRPLQWLLQTTSTASQSEQCSAPVLSYLSTVLMRAYISMSCPTLCDPTDSASPGCSVHGDSRGKNTVVGCHALLQGVFPTQRWKLCLLHLLHGNADEFFTASATWEAPTVVTVLASLSVLKLLFRCLQWHHSHFVSFHVWLFLSPWLVPFSLHSLFI